MHYTETDVRIQLILYLFILVSCVSGIRRSGRRAKTELTESASLTSMRLSSRCPIFSLRRFLSIVRICSSKTTESLARPKLSAYTFICVGRLVFASRLVMAAAITVGLYLFPTSFCTISTGRKPPCSEPSTGLVRVIEFLFYRRYSFVSL